MTLIMLSIGAIIIISILILIVKRYNTENRELEQLNVSLEKEISKLEYALEKNREVYLAERKALLAKQEADNLRVDKYKKQLNSYSQEQSEYYSEMDNMDNTAKEMTPEEFLKLANKSNKVNSGIHDFTGIYILENKTMDKFYVGQSISVFKRASAHFTGKGNMDIYEDYKNGEKWTIRTIALSNSGFKSINALEKHFIKYHSSTWNGYNRTVGNVN